MQQNMGKLGSVSIWLLVIGLLHFKSSHCVLSQPIFENIINDHSQIFDSVAHGDKVTNFSITISSQVKCQKYRWFVLICSQLQSVDSDMLLDLDTLAKDKIRDMLIWIRKREEKMSYKCSSKIGVVKDGALNEILWFLIAWKLNQMYSISNKVVAGLYCVAEGSFFEDINVAQMSPILWTDWGRTGGRGSFTLIRTEAGGCGLLSWQ